MSVEVMWKFVEKHVEKEDFILLCKNKYGDEITKEPKNWDISLLFKAIIQCDAITKGAKPKKPKYNVVCEPTNKVNAVCCLKDLRNDLFHRRPLEISEDEYRAMVTLSEKCYTVLLEDEAKQFEKNLKDTEREYNSFIACLWKHFAKKVHALFL